MKCMFHVKNYTRPELRRLLIEHPYHPPVYAPEWPTIPKVHLLDQVQYVMVTASVL